MNIVKNVKEKNNQICRKMVNQKLTLEIPESLFEQLHHLAELTGQSIESLALQSITSNLPCLTEKVHDLDELLSRVTPDNLHSEIMPLR